MRALFGIFLLSTVFSIAHGIMGGDFTILGTCPSCVSLRREKNCTVTLTKFTENFCGGAILNKRWILTAAHCTRKALIPKLSDLLIGMGNIRFDSSSKMHQAEKIIRHPSYATSVQYLKYDIALIRTSSDIEFGERIQPISLVQEWIGEARPVTVSGWGLMNHMQDAVYARFIYLKTLANDDCIQKYGGNASEFIDESILCASSNFVTYGVGLCHGDSGNPLISNGQLVGIALWDVPEPLPCAIGKPDQYTRISSYISWIKYHVNVSVK